MQRPTQREAAARAAADESASTASSKDARDAVEVDDESTGGVVPRARSWRWLQLRRKDARRRARWRRARRRARDEEARASRNGASDEICRTLDMLRQRSSPLIVAAMLGAGLCARASLRARCRWGASWAALRRRRSSPSALSRAVVARAKLSAACASCPLCSPLSVGGMWERGVWRERWCAAARCGVWCARPGRVGPPNFVHVGEGSGVSYI